MRLFVAVTPPAGARADLAAAVAAVREGPGGPRWADPDRWHLTLAFLGAVEPDRLDPLRRGLAPVAAAHPPFDLAVAGAGTFPARGAPRVLWAGLVGDVAALRSLAAAVVEAVGRAGVEVDRRPFRPHLTLGRWRRGDPASRAAADTLAPYRGPAFPVTGLTLVRSHLGPTPTYEPLADWELG